MIPALVRAASTLSKPGLTGGAATKGIAAAADTAIPNLGKLAKGIEEVGKSASTGLDFLQSAKQEFGTATSLIQGLVKDIAEAPILPFKMALATMQGLVSQYVAAFSPQAANQFGMIMKDISAVIGKTLLPVTRAFGQVLRFLGDALATVAPHVEGVLIDLIKQATPLMIQLGSVLKQLLPTVVTLVQVFGTTLLTVMKVLEPIGSAFADVLSALAEPIQLLVEIVGPFVPILVEFAMAMQPAFMILKLMAPLMRFFAQELRNTMTVIRDLLGIQAPKVEEGKSGGMAFVQAGTTNAQSALSRVQQNAFGVGGQDSPAKQTANNTATLVQIFKDMPKKFADELGKVLKDKGQDVAKGAVEFGAGFMPFGRPALNLALGRNPFG